VVQSEDLLLSTVIVAPTSRSAPARIFRPTISVAGQVSQVLVEQLTAVSPDRLGERVGSLARSELEELDAAVRLVLALD
jgi:mRNA interferase MazF